jgi:hypothetical protein
VCVRVIQEWRGGVSEHVGACACVRVCACVCMCVCVCEFAYVCACVYCSVEAPVCL